jgi:hypothetical protein
MLEYDARKISAELNRRACYKGSSNYRMFSVACVNSAFSKCHLFGGGRIENMALSLKYGPPTYQSSRKLLLAGTVVPNGQYLD